jgi:hypothetical protein
VGACAVGRRLAGDPACVLGTVPRLCPCARAVSVSLLAVSTPPVSLSVPFRPGDSSPSADPTLAPVAPRSPPGRAVPPCVRHCRSRLFGDLCSHDPPSSPSPCLRRLLPAPCPGDSFPTADPPLALVAPRSPPGRAVPPCVRHCRSCLSGDLCSHDPPSPPSPCPRRLPPAPSPRAGGGVRGDLGPATVVPLSVRRLPVFVAGERHPALSAPCLALSPAAGPVALAPTSPSSSLSLPRGARVPGDWALGAWACRALPLAGAPQPAPALSLHTRDPPRPPSSLRPSVPVRPPWAIGRSLVLRPPTPSSRCCRNSPPSLSGPLVCTLV